MFANSRIDITIMVADLKLRIYSIPKSVVFCLSNIERAGKWLNVCHVSLCCRKISRYWKFFRCFSFPFLAISISFLYFCIHSSILHWFNRFSSPPLNQIREERMFFYVLCTSGKILLSKYLSIIRAALLTFELSNPSGHIKIVYTKTFIHSFVFLHHLLCRYFK
jgi:hypothetical protein